MGAGVVRLRSELRSSWRSWLALAVLIGLFSGAVIGVAAGARRTATAFPRMAERTAGGDALVAAFNTGLEGYYEDLARHPDVESLALMAGMPVFPADENGAPIFISGNAVAPIDGRLGWTVNRPDVVRGRLPQPDRAREVLLNEVAAQRLRVDVGSTLPMVALEGNPADPEGEPIGRPFTARVVGVGRFLEGVVPTTKFDNQETILMTRAAYRDYGKNKRLNFDGAYVTMKDPDKLDAFRADAERLAAADPEQTGGEVLFADFVDRNALVERTIAPQAIALGLFAAFAALAGFLIMGQALSRQLTDDGADAPVLRALGLTRQQVFLLAMARAGVVAVLAAVIAVGVAVAMSPLFPIGAARRAELDPGLAVNGAFLLVGAAAVIALFLLRATVPAWRLSRHPAALQATATPDVTRTSWLADRLAGTGLPASAAAGVRMALEPGAGRTAVPVRTTLAGAVVGLAVVATTLTFAANLERLVSTPRLYGRAWDVTFDGSFGPVPLAKVEPVLRSSPVVAQWTGGFYGEAAIDGRAVTAVGLDGDVTPVIVDGRAPRSPTEVALGTSTLDRTGRRIGQRVSIALGGEDVSKTVVGRAVFPALGRGSFPQTGLGDGVLTDASVLQPPPDPEIEAAIGAGKYFNFFLIELRENATAADVRTLTRRLEGLCPEDQDCRVVRRAADERPPDIANLDRIRWTPVVLAGVVALMAAATVGHTLVTSIRRRRRDLALLKTIGFQRGQVSAAVAWQATTIAAIAAVVGLPLGLALGRVLWRALAEELGIVPDVVTPTLALAVAAPATLLLVNLIAVIPGRVAGRIRPAVALRSE